jgi:hypothetical protein
MDRTPEPTNDHERTIAEALDSKMLATDSPPYQSIVAEVIVGPYVPTMLSVSNHQR